MKKFILLLMFALLSFGAMAQIKVKGSVTPKIETIAVVRSYAATLNRIGENYYVTLKSTNEFDGIESITLGKGEAASTTTLGDLLTLFNTLGIGESVTLEDVNGKEILVIRDSKNWLKFIYDLQAGNRYLKKSDITYFVRVMGEEMKKKSTH